MRTHLELAAEKARSAESRAEELEQRFRERMEMSLSFELAKIDALKRRATGPTSALLLGWVGERSDEPAVEGFRQLHDLRQRYQRLQAVTNCRAQMSSEEVRRRLSHFYARICPSKLGNVTRIVDSFEARRACVCVIVRACVRAWLCVSICVVRVTKWSCVSVRSRRARVPIAC